MIIHKYHSEKRTERRIADMSEKSLLNITLDINSCFVPEHFDKSFISTDPQGCFLQRHGKRVINLVFCQQIPHELSFRRQKMNLAVLCFTQQDVKVGVTNYICDIEFLSWVLSIVNGLQRSRERDNHQFSVGVTHHIDNTNIFVTVLRDSPWPCKQPGLTVFPVLVLADDITSQRHVPHRRLLRELSSYSSDSVSLRVINRFPSIV